MNAIETYRANAAAQRAAAAQTKLQNRREMHERAAAVWETMADGAEETLSKTAINLAAKERASR
ncbi:hypothetical protein [Sphingomonas immobilis]|uniref:Transcriptional regulator n=1 Tax=Sphingomonas immobilis TaxID=3063997 RepID=A0ABT8ZVX5_9SPHN|nr:hypothetical protein [Sphingomonas sp. CA1-15]MDO7841725.1 hypothetical protein [Sphingomonas sp. CA1-15]